MELHFGTIWEPRAAKINKKRGPKTGPEKGRPQECPTAFESLRAEPKEEGKGGGKPPPLAIRRFGKVRKIRKNDDGIYMQTSGSADVLIR